MDPNIQHVLFLYESVKQQLHGIERKIDKIDRKLNKLLPDTSEETIKKEK